MQERAKPVFVQVGEVEVPASGSEVIHVTTHLNAPQFWALPGAVLGREADCAAEGLLGPLSSGPHLGL